MRSGGSRYASSRRAWNVFSVLALAVALVATAVLPAQAEDIVGRWRFEIHVGATDPGDSIPSEVGNVMTVRDDQGFLINVIDPRDRILQTREAKLRTDPRIDFRMGYGFAAWKSSELYIDFGFGYYKQRIQDIEFSYALDVRDPEYSDFQTDPVGPLFGNTELFYKDNTGAVGYNERWESMLLEGGELTMFPVSVNFLFRFNPTKRLNPYFGGGLGYYFVEFTPSPEWTAMADALDQTCVTYVTFRNGQPNLSNRDVEVDADPGPDPGDGSDPCRLPQPWVGRDGYMNFGHEMKRPEIDAPDTVFLEMRGGMEWQWKPKTAFFADVRFTWAQKNITITADGREKFGVGIPSGLFTPDTVPVPRGGMPAYISYYAGMEEDLAAGDILRGIGSPGEYFLNGGVLDYGGWSFSVGVRFTL